MERDLFRFIRSATPTLDDFRSQGALGKPMRWDQENPEATRRWNGGVSVYDDFARACDLAARAGFEWIASITVEDPVRHEVSQYGRDQHHYTIFGEPEQLMALVSEVRPVPEPPGE